MLVALAVNLVIAVAKAVAAPLRHGGTHACVP